MSGAPANQRTTNTWDFESRLTQVVVPMSVANTFVYNGDSQRVQKQDSGSTTNIVWDGENILQEFGANSNIIACYSIQPGLYGRLISQYNAMTSLFYYYDGLGSTVQLGGSPMEHQF